MSYQFLPPLSDAEYEALRADIAANGMRHPIIVDERGKILDGHHRARIAAELGFKPEREVVAGLTEQDKRDLAFTMNTARRHMDAAQRRAAVVASLKADPQLSDRQHGRRTGTSHPTVAGIRAELEAAGRLESFTSRISADGRGRPSTQTPARRDPEPTSPGPAVATPGGPDNDTPTGPESAPTAEPPQAPGRSGPPAWDPKERRRHEENVRRIRDIEAARRQAETIVTDVVAAVVTVVAGCRYGETGLVTKDMVREIREAIDLLEGEL